MGEREAEGAAVPETPGALGEGAQEGGLPPVGYLWGETECPEVLRNAHISHYFRNPVRNTVGFAPGHSRLLMHHPKSCRSGVTIPIGFVAVLGVTTLDCNHRF